MAEAVGLVLSAVQLFPPTVAIYAAYCESKEIGAISVTHQIQLRTERVRYEVWGEYMGLKSKDDSGTDQPQHQMHEWWAAHPEKLALVLDTMALIALKLLEVEKQQKKYKVEGSNVASPGVASRMLDDVQKALAGSSFHLAYQQLAAVRIEEHKKLAKELKSRHNFLSSLRFSLFGKLKLENLIADLRSYNDTLEKIIGFAAVLKGKLYSRVLDVEKDSQNQQGLTELANAVQVNEPMIAHIAQRKATYLALKDRIRNGTANNVLSNNPGPRLTYSNLVIKNRHSGREFGTYENTPVMIEWKILSPELPGDAGICRIRDLAIFLSDSTLATSNFKDSMHIMNCMGYLKQPGKSDAVALIYRTDASPHRTLLELITGQSNFSLGSRYRLARELAEGLFYMHLTGWLHKGISSHNIIISGDTTLPGRTHDLHLFLAGFNSARLDAPGQISEKFQIDEQADLYHHPEYQGSNKKTASYNRQYDIYSLGLVLLELGTWEPIKDSGKYNVAKYNPTKFQSRLLKGPAEYLTSTMGNAYKKAVHWCLKDQFDTGSGLASMPDEERSQAFWDAVVVPLASCNIPE
ncbi:kinase-like domain-containing protein [Kalaharituber pfeilii]|nr:kinase-like domain-containing protein [Kalaharituber pfeilii]